MNRIGENEYNLVMLGRGLFEEQPGGANRYMTNFATMLSKKKRNVTVFCPAIDDNKYNEEDYNFNVIRYKNNVSGKISKMINFIKGSNFISRKFEMQVLKGKKNVVINSHFALNAWPLLRLIRKKNIPLITHFHGPWALESLIEYPDSLYMKLRARIAMYIEKKVYEQSKYIITLSEAFKNILLEHYNISSEKIIIIPGATEINDNVAKLSKQEAKKLLNLNENDIHIITVRRLVNRMGLEEFIQASNLVENKNVKFIIGGKGPLENKLKEIHKKCDSDVIFKGFIPDEELPILYRAADLYVLPTKNLEGFGLVTIEALSYGTPVIATNVGGSKEILEKIMPHFLINCDINEIANKINDFLKNNLEIPNEKNLSDFVKKNYSWDNVIENFEKLIIYKLM